jgi:1-acyl-sn-glycerol-3-phosphate acyltransferase
MSRISTWILKWLGWKFVGKIPADLKKFICAVVPHTSNWDFPIGILVRSALNRDIKFLGKHTLFQFPYGFIFYWLGGYPVNRKKSANIVEAVVKIFNEKETFAIALAPEGTRKKVDKLKTGFYHMAKQAHVPIILVKFDYEHKIFEFREPFYPSDDESADFEVINNYFKGVKGFNPAQSFGI